MPARLTSEIFVISREACRDRTSPPQVQWLRRPRFKQGCDHYCAMRTKCEHRVNGKLHGSEPLADFVQRFMRPTEPLKLRRGCSRKSATSHSPSRRELDPRASGAPLISD